MKKQLSSLLLLCSLAAPAMADVSALLVIEPTSRKEGFLVSQACVASSLTRLLGQKVAIAATENLTDAMRDTRSGGYDMFVAPAQVVASALGHGYDLVGSTQRDEQYVLVGTVNTRSAAELRGNRIYLPQQDSIYTYLARGMLTANGMSFKDLGSVIYEHIPQAGLAAIEVHAAEVTVIRQADWEVWERANPGRAKVLAMSGEVPGGFSVAIKKNVAPDTRAKLTKWLAASSQSCGLKAVLPHPDLAGYKKVAELGTFTPTSLPGATVVGVEEVRRLQASGAVVVDTRTEKEYNARHIPRAVFVPYHEKSLKDIAYEAKLDDFSGLASLDASKPVIFHCNGAECWKSYKASRAALAKGFPKVYWFREGMPAWEKAKLEIAQK